MIYTYRCERVGDAAMWLSLGISVMAGSGTHQLVARCFRCRLEPRLAVGLTGSWLAVSGVGWSLVWQSDSPARGSLFQV